MAQAQLGQADERHRLDITRLTEREQECARLQKLLEDARRETEALSKRLDTAQQQHQSDVRTLNERMDATERHWLKEVDEARLLLASERKSVQALEKQLANERGQHVAQLQEASTQFASQSRELERVKDQVADSQQLAGRLQIALKEQVHRADKAIQLLHETQTQASRQIDTLQQQLREQATHIVQLSTKAVTTRSRK
jgi:hypothetical protein